MGIFKPNPLTHLQAAFRQFWNSCGIQSTTILALLLTMTMAYAQGFPPDILAKKDSLSAVIASNPNPAQKVETYLALSRLLRPVEPESSLEYAQRAHDLAGQNSTHGDNQRVQAEIGECLIGIGRLKATMQDSIAAMDHFDQALALGVSKQAGKIHFEKGQFLFFRGYALKAKFELKKALEGQERALPGDQNAEWKMTQAKILNGLGNIYTQEGKYDSAAKAIVGSIEINQELGNQRFLSFQYANLLNVYQSTGDFRKALEYGAKAFAIAEEDNDCLMMGRFTYSMALVHQDAKDQEDYLEGLQRAVEIFRACPIRDLNTGVPFAELGSWHLRKGENELAKAYYREAKSHYEEEPDGPRQVDYYLQFSILNIHLGNFSEAEAQLEMAGEGLQYTGNIEQRRRYLDFLATLYEETNRPGKALEAMRSLYEVNDSIRNLEMLSMAEQTQIKFDVEVTEKELLKAQLASQDLEHTIESKTATFRQWVLGSILVAVILIFGLFLLIGRVRKRRVELVDTRNKAILREREEARKREALSLRMEELERQALQAQMNPHFIFNSLTALQAYVMAGENQKASDYLLVFSLLIRDTLSASREARIPLSRVIELLESYLKLEQMRMGDKLKYDIQVDLNLEADLIKIPNMLIQPLVENAIYHGIIPKKESGTVSIWFEENSDSLKVMVMDDGIGRKERAEQQSLSKYDFPSLGTKITRERLGLLWKRKTNPFRIEDLYSSDGNPVGTLVTLSIPI